MKGLKTLFTLTMLMSFSILLSAKDSAKQTVYMFGFSASFNDSIVYFTPVQQVDGYIKPDRTHFLADRNQYSYQLRNFFDNRGQLHRTCVTLYSTDKAKAEKKYQKLKEKYTTKSKNKFDVVELTNEDFQFQSVEPGGGTVYVNSEEAEREAAKSAQMEKKQQKKNRPKKPKGEKGK